MLERVVGPARMDLPRGSDMSRSEAGALPRGWLFAACILLPFAAAVADPGDPLPPIDAWSTLPRQAVASAGPPLPAGIDLQLDPRSGLPTFLRAADTFDIRAAVGGGPEAQARAYLAELAPHYRMNPDDVAALRLQAVHALRAGGRIVHLQSAPQGIEVFRERAAVLLHADGRLAAIGGTVSGVGGSAARATLATAAFGDAGTALARALQDFGVDDAAVRARVQALPMHGGYQRYQLAEAADPSTPRLAAPARVKPVWFRLPNGLVPAWYVEIMVAADSDAGAQPYAYVIDAKQQRVLFRHRQLEEHTFDFRVFAEADGERFPYPDPAGRGGVPHPTGVPDGFQPSFVLPNLVTAGDNARGDPWLPLGATETVGNNVDAYVDLFAPDGLSGGDFRADITAPGAFDRAFDPEQEPDASEVQRKAAITQLFYLTNWLHDWFYDAGFDEISGNAQQDNYGRGGIDGDSMLAEAQDHSGTDNANMFTPADGGRPRMQMYLWSGGTMFAVESATLGAQYPSVTADFGAQAFDLTANLVLAVAGSGQPSEACAPLVNNVAGNVVLVDRGSCTFVAKAANVQAAGGVGMLLANQVPGLPPSMGGVDPAVTIPSLGISLGDGAALKAALGDGAVSVRLLRITGVRHDSAMDGTIVAHEWGHYISNRLVMNSSGLTTNQARGMGEGWSDFHALLMTVQEQDLLVPANANFSGIYPTGAHSIAGPSFSVSPNNGYYFGIRRYPYSTRPDRNPLTFRHIDNSQPLPPAPPPVKPNGQLNAQVHNTGTVWATMLWGCYAALLNDHPRLSFDEAQDRMKRYLVAGYKLTPAAPTFVEARDALLAAMAVEDADDFAACATAFAARGLGTGAVAPDRFSEDHAGVVESYGTGAVLAFGSGSELLDDRIACTVDGVLDSGETGTLRVVVRNGGLAASAPSTLLVESTAPGISFPDGATVELPALLPFSSTVAEVPVRATAITGIEPVVFELALDDGDAVVAGEFHGRLNSIDLPLSALVETFEAAEFTWTTDASAGVPASERWQRLVDGGVAMVRGPDLGYPALNALATPPIQVAAGEDFVVTLLHRYQFEADTVWWDGGVIELSTDGGDSWVDVAQFVDPGYDGVLTDEAANPLANRAAFSGQSAGYPAFVPLVLDFGNQLAGQTLLIRFLIGTDLAVGDIGWDLAELAVEGVAAAPFTLLAPQVEGCFGLQGSGDQQATAIGTSFPAPLALVAHDASGVVAAGRAVRFTLPATGASATFDGGGSVFDTVTDAAGVAGSPALTANASGGVYTATATVGSSELHYTLRNLVGDAVFADGFEPSGSRD
jgi:large repetitive protein